MMGKEVLGHEEFLQLYVLQRAGRRESMNGFSSAKGGEKAWRAIREIVEEEERKGHEAAFLPKSVEEIDAVLSCTPTFLKETIRRCEWQIDRMRRLLGDVVANMGGSNRLKEKNPVLAATVDKYVTESE